MKKQHVPRMRLLHYLPLLLAICFLFTTSLAKAQKFTTTTGVVLDSLGKPIVGATISVKKTRISTISDAQGNFSLNAPANSILTISYVGLDNQEVKATNSPMSITLSSKAANLGDVVVVGYGTQRKENLTGSIAVLNVAEADKRVTHDVARELQGQVAGVQVSGSGVPGEGVVIHIRGVSSITNNNPLYIIDGVPTMTPFDFPTGDIESLQVLKDASAGAIYGFRGSAGVIIITTKRGKNGPLKVNYNGYAGFQWNPKKLPVTNRVQYQTIVNAAETNANIGLAPGNDPTSSKYIASVNTDWQKEGFKNGYTQNHDLTLSGGNEFTTYSIAFGYYNQTGTTVAGPTYARYNVSANLQGKKGIFSYGAKMAYTQGEYRNLAYPRLHGTGNEIVDLITAIPTMPVYDANRLGGYGGVDQNTQRAISLNIIGVNNLITNKSTHNRFLGSFWGELEILKNLKYRVNVSFDRTDYHNFYFEPAYDLGWFYPSLSAYYSDARGTPYTALIENTLTYKFSVGNHNVELLAGTAYQKDSNNTIFGSSSNLSQPYFLAFDNVSNPANKLLFGNSGDRNLYSPIFARINYNYDNRYLLTANFRRDGASSLPGITRYGNFSGGSVGWNINKEKFIHLPAAITSLKLRAGIGTLGNVEAIGYYDYQTVVNSNASYVFGNTLANGTTQTQVFSGNLQWEKKDTRSIGLDVGLFRDQLTFTAEYYNNKVYGILLAVPIPGSVGATNTPIVNAASFTNKGLEFSLAYHSRGNSDFHYNISANASTLQNKVLSLGNGDNPIYGAYSKTEVGHEVGELYGFKTEGIFQSTGDLAKHATQTNAGVGDVMFKDVNGSGAITDSDRTYLGSAIPKFYFGFNFSANYKGFDASIFIQGNTGGMIANGIYQALMTGQYGNQSTDELNFWKPTNTNTNIPRPIIGDPNGNGRNSDRFIQSGDYARIQTAQIGYTISPKLLDRTHVFKTCRFYLSGQNLYTLTKYKGYDPDFINDGTVNKGFDYGSFPNPRSLLFGVQVGF